MPFTFAHAAAAVPLRRPLGRYGVMSALVIGSLSPDLQYFLPLDVAHDESHSLSGLLWFCLPAGLLGYALFHLFLKGPLLGLMPEPVLRRLCAHALRFRSFPPFPWPAVVVSALLGASTHILWDSFTHAAGSPVRAFAPLRMHLFDIAGYSIQTYKLLQHGSTCIGFALLAWWSWRWLKQTPQRPAILPVTLTPIQRLLAIASLVSVPAIAGARAGIREVGTLTGIPALKTFVSAAVFSGLPALALALMVYCVGWHWRSRSTGRALWVR